jgi:MFS family permease
MSNDTTAGRGVTSVLGVPHGSRGAVVAVGAIFAINGLVIGSWAGVLPALRTRLGIDAGTLAVLLFVVGVAAVASMQVGGRMADRVGSRRVTLSVLPLMIGGALVLAFATSCPMAIVAGVLIGLGNGATDVAMNALGVAVEKARPIPVLSRFHAFWSIGTFAGAAVVFLSAFAVGDQDGSVVLPAMLTVAVLAAAALMVTRRWIPET